MGGMEEQIKALLRRLRMVGEMCSNSRITFKGGRNYHTFNVERKMKEKIQFYSSSGWKA